MAKSANDIYAELTASIIKRLEHADENAWRLPWHFSGEAAVFSPMNASTRQPYRGLNTVAFWIAAEDNEYTSGWWATYKQWAALGAQVRKGETATYGIKWVESKKLREARKNAQPGEQVLGGSMIPVGFAVFNADQVDGWEKPEQGEGPAPIDHAEEFFAAIGADVRSQPSGFYMPSQDFIGIPPIDSFDEAVRYYSVLAHEHVHWTGHKSRNDRDLTGRFGSESYAAEELVAELGSAFLCAHLGLDNEPREDHAQYIKNWLSVLRSDPKAVQTAASLAQKAVAYLTDRGDAVAGKSVAA